MSLVTLAETKLQLNIPTSDTTQDAELLIYIDAATEVVEFVTGPIVPKQYVNEVHDGGYPFIMLFNPPILTVDSVVEYLGRIAYTITPQPLGSTVDNYGYSLDSPATGKLTRRSGAGTPMSWLSGRSSIIVTYTAGRVLVPAAVRLAALLDIGDIWQKTQQGGRDQASDDVWMGAPVSFPRLKSELESTARVVGIA